MPLMVRVILVRTERLLSLLHRLMVFFSVSESGTCLHVLFLSFFLSFSGRKRTTR